MAGMAVDGLVSGFNTTDMISQLMQLEAAPQTLLKGKVSKAESFVSALQSLNTKISSLAESAKKATEPESWQAVTASSTAKSVTVATTAGAQPSSLTFSVEQLATRQSSVSGATTDLSSFFGGTVPANLTLVTGEDDGVKKLTDVPLAGVTDLAGLAAAINKVNGGASATVVNVGDGKSRLQLTAKDSGEVGAFDLYRGRVTAADLSATTPPSALMGRTASTTGPGNAVVTTARDAHVILFEGVDGAQQDVYSSTNTFSGIVTGLDFTLTAAETDPVTVSVGRDDAALKKLGSDLVTNISTVLAEVASRTKPTTTRSSDGRDVVTGGVLSADSAVRGVRQAIVSAASLPVDGVSPSSVGLVLERDGTMTFDSAKFTAALAADPAKVQAMLTTIAERIETAADGLSDSRTGSLSLKIQGQQSYVKNLSQQVDNWDDRLALRRTTLERTYSSLEVSLSNINAQANWLTSQLAQLNSNNQN